MCIQVDSIEVIDIPQIWTEIDKTEQICVPYVPGHPVGNICKIWQVWSLE